MSASEGFTLLFPNRSFMDKYSQARTFRKNIILAADLNCDMLKLRSPEAVAKQDPCDSVNLMQLMKESTRVTSGILKSGSIDIWCET